MNFSISNLVRAQALLNERFQAPELRDKQSPILTLGQLNAEIMIASHQELRTREDRPISAYILKRSRRATVGVDRTYNHTGQFGDSLDMDIEWTSFTDKFTMSLKQLDNNMIGFNAALANNFAQCFMNIRADIEQFLVTYLFAERTAVNAATTNGSFNTTTQAFEIVNANPQGLFFENAKSMMRQNDYNGNFDVIANANIYTYATFYAAQGGSNAVNTAFQFSGMNIRESIGLQDGNYPDGVALFLPENTFGVLDWIPPVNRIGRGDYNSTLGGYGSIIDPVSGMTFAVHGYAGRANTLAQNGSLQDDVMEFEVSIDISSNTAPLSNPNETVVYEVALV